jgi:hypothetical protein
MSAASELIEIHVAELRQLFNSIDPSPFEEKDLDPKAEEFIVGWAREAPLQAALALRVYLDRPAGRLEETTALTEAVHQFFAGREQVTRRRLKQMFRVGRISLAIGILFLGISLAAGSLVESAVGEERLGGMLREGLLIGGWVAMWRPLEIFLYDWWPLRADIRLFSRLSRMPIQIRYTGSDIEAWRQDWPAVLARHPRAPLTDTPGFSLPQ